MKVKNRLSLQFTLMFAILLLIVLMGIYLFVKHNRVRSFFDKLDDRALTIAQFYLAEDNLSKDNFNHIIKKFPQSLDNELIRIYNDSFQPKFISEDSVHWKMELLQQIITQEKIHLSIDKKQVTGIYYKDNSGNYIIIVSAIDNSGVNDVRELGLIMIFFFLFSLSMTFLMGRVFSREALFPIVKITGNLKAIRSSSLDKRLNVDQGKIDEIDLLSISINELLEHLEQSFSSQKSFISHASHELRTPITMILGEAETTLMLERKNEEYKTALTGIAQEAGRLGGIINSLMDLMQTNLESTELQDVRIDELVWEIVDELEGIISGTKVNVKYDLPNETSKYTIHGNSQLLFIAISNIIKNAIKFSDQKEVKCQIFCDINCVNIVIKDQGIGIIESDLQKIFQPFFRSSNAIGYPGNGVGLSLSANIIRVHNGTIKVESEQKKGTTLHITFPIYANR